VVTGAAPRDTARPLVVLVPDGASEPGIQTTLSRANTPHLDALCASQGVGRLRTIPIGANPGTEVGLARLVGITADAPARGWLEAAAAGLDVGIGRAAWRLDLVAGTATAKQLTGALGALGASGPDPDPEVQALNGGRHVLIGPAGWGDAAAGHDRPIPMAWQHRLASVEDALGVRLRVWGRAAHPTLPVRADLAVLPDSPAALGLTRSVRATSLPDLQAALRAIKEARHSTLLIHDAGPDEAAHRRDPQAKRAAIERFDATVVGPVLAVADAHGAAVLVAPDHGCDPETGSHTAEPVPATWPGAPGIGRLTEAQTADAPVADAATTVHELAPAWEDAA